MAMIIDPGDGAYPERFAIDNARMRSADAR
jgi:hypothetical protein